MTQLVGRGLRHSFGGVVALDEVDIDVAPGEIVAVVGPNGSGKTTLLDALSGWLRCDHGRVLLGGRDVTRCTPGERARLGMVRTFQEGRLLEGLSALDNVLIGLHPHPRLGVRRSWTPATWRARREAAMAALHAVGLADLWNEPASTLSHGQRRRLELARAMVGQPSVLLLDEPTAGLAEADTRTVAELVDDARRSGCAVLLVEHDLDLVGRIADRAVVLDEGRVVGQGDPGCLLADRGVRHLLGLPAEQLA
jgi:ABC-type branched-subunit amino acid transport system ATPase component